MSRSDDWGALRAVSRCAVMVGVICDSLVVENARAERAAAVGSLVSSTQIAFAAGGLTGTALAGAIPQFCGASDALMFLIRGGAALCLAPLSLMLVAESKRGRGTRRDGREDASPSALHHPTGEGTAGGGASGCSSVRATARDVWRTAQRLDVCRPVLFIFAFAAAPNSSDAFNSYLLQRSGPLCATNATGGCAEALLPPSTSPSMAIGQYCASFDNATRPLAQCGQQWGGLGFSQATFSLIGLLGSVGSVVGNALYRSCLLSAPWHLMFAATVLIASGLSALQLLLMFRSLGGWSGPHRTAHLASHCPAAPRRRCSQQLLRACALERVCALESLCSCESQFRSWLACASLAAP